LSTRSSPLFSGLLALRYARDAKLDVDCVEIDPYLRQILKYNFSEEKRREVNEQREAVKAKLGSDWYSKKDPVLKRLDVEVGALECANVHIVHDDFLTFAGQKRYDLILMNPPFSEGCNHLLKALDLQRRGGRIVCLLNAETLRNPYTNARKLLAAKLADYGARIEYIEDAFTEAERRTDVEIALVRVNIPASREESRIFDNMRKAAKIQDPEGEESTELVFNDWIDALIQRFEAETSAGIALIREYEAMRPYIMESLDTSAKYDHSILTLTVGADSNYNQTVSVNTYLQKTRLKYWRGVYQNRKFTERLTSNLREDYVGKIDALKDYDFSRFNIECLYADMNSRLVDGVKDTIMALFDKLTTEHSWYPESKNNVHYWTGWKSNAAHKVNNKVVLPSYGLHSQWNRTAFDVYEAHKFLGDIEKVFNYLDGGMTSEIELHTALEMACNRCQTRGIVCKYFTIDIFKKGTVHIKFTNTALVDKLNIYAARNRAWLPPDYGKTRYRDMDEEAQQAVNEFQGEKEYEKVLNNAGYYLFEVGKDVLMLTAMG